MIKIHGMGGAHPISIQTDRSKSQTHALQSKHTSPIQSITYTYARTLRVALARRQRLHARVKVRLKEEGDAEALLPKGREDAVWRGPKFAVAPVVWLRTGWVC